jgi:hypothetical protein
MRQAVIVSLALVLGALFAGSCKEEESIAALIDDIIDETNTQVDILCGDCSMQLGLTRSECEDMFGFIGPSKRRCYADAYERDEGISRDYLNCIKPLEEEFTECERSRLDCNDIQNSIAPCSSDYDIGRRDCIELPQTIRNALQNCDG